MNDPKPIDDGGLAFPFDPQGIQPYGGMTLRDWYAGQALAGEISGWSHPHTTSDFAHGDNAIHTARRVYKLADAMIAARKEAR